MTAGRGRRLRTAARLAALLVLSGAALGVVVPAAHGSCAGPQLQVVGLPATPPASEDTDADARPVVRVSRGQALRVEVTNVNDEAAGCDDVGGGCDDPGPAAPVPARGAVLMLEQGGRRWSLGTQDATGPQRAVSYEVVLPEGLGRGEADLVLDGPVLGAGPQLRLVVT